MFGYFWGETRRLKQIQAIVLKQKASRYSSSHCWNVHICPNDSALRPELSAGPPTRTGLGRSVVSLEPWTNLEPCGSQHEGFPTSKNHSPGEITASKTCFFQAIFFRKGSNMFSPRALTSGSLVSIVTFLLWRPRQRIFFDRVCIHQSDGEAQLQFLRIFGSTFYENSGLEHMKPNCKKEPSDRWFLISLRILT